MNIDSLRLFVEVAHKLSFAAVAEERGINPSSVSRVVNQLENHLGVRLLQRTTRTMTLTEAGAIFLGRASSIIEEMEHAEEEARLLSATPSGTLRLTASVAFGESLLVPLLPDFRAAYPDLRLDLLFTDANVDIVAENIDLAIRLGWRIDGDFVCTKLFPTTYRVVASPRYLENAPPIRKPTDLQQHACTVFALHDFRTHWNFRPRQQQSTAQVERIPISYDAMVSSALSLRSIVLGGGGPALLADWLINDDIMQQRLIDVLPNYEASAAEFDSAAWLIYPNRSYLPQKVRVTIDFLKQRLRNLSSTPSN